MALEVVIGAPFSGKGRFAADEVADREADGELGLVVIDFTRLFGALFPGAHTSFRDEAVSETAAPQAAGYLVEAAISQALAKGLSGYVLTNNLQHAGHVVTRLGVDQVIEIDAQPEVLADRVDQHLTALRKRVPRARTEKARHRCAAKIARWYQDLVKDPPRYERYKARRRARAAKKRGQRRWVRDAKPGPRQFDEAAFVRGLSPAGTAARAALLADGKEATPAAIFRRVLKERMGSEHREIMVDYETRQIRFAVEIRDADGSSPGRLMGRLMRYGDVGERGREVFSPGALRWPANGIRIDEQHASSPARGSTQPPILRTIPIVDGDEVRIDCLLPDTQRGRDLATLMRMDPPVYSGLSVEFRALKEHRAGGRRVIDDALLAGAGLTDAPSYGNTPVEVREERPRRRRLWL